MSTRKITERTVCALGTSEEPFLVVRQDIVGLRLALESMGAFDELGQLADYLTIFDGNGSEIANPFSAHPCETSVEPSEEEEKKFFARLSAVLASQAALAADIASGDRRPQQEFRKCTCCWCYFGLKC